MKNFARSIISSLLLIALSGMYVHDVPSAAVKTGKPAPQDKREGFKPQIVKGESVALHARALRARNKGVARAMKDLEKKGFRQAFDQSVSFVAAKGRQTASTGSRLMRHAAFQSDQSETFYNDGYEMTFISYDDGDPNTWEGVVYEHDPDMYEYSYTVTLDISGQPDTWAPTVETYYPADGSAPVSSTDPSYYDGSYQPYDPMYDQPAQYNMARQKDGRGAADTVRFTKASYAPVQQRQSRWRDRLYRWSKCVVGGCTVSAIGCIASGPAWLGCFTAWCGGTEVGCVILSW
jgi:hypothetical protein